MRSAAILAAETATDPINSEADLRKRWRALMGLLGFGQRLLRFVFVGPDRCFIKALCDVEISAVPDSELVTNVMSVISDLLDEREPGTTVAFPLTRPGRGRISNSDRRWADLVTDAARTYDVPLEPIFRANDDALLQIAA